MYNRSALVVLGTYRTHGEFSWRYSSLDALPEAHVGTGLYRRMVDENVVRKDLSFAEMAHAAQVYAANPGTEASDLTAAVTDLFQSAPYSKRSYIRSFAYLLNRIGSVLKYPTEVPRAPGVALVRVLKVEPELADRIRAEFQPDDMRTISEELEVLRRYADLSSIDAEEGAAPVKPKTRRAGGTKTTFHIRSAAGQVKCTAAMGRLEIRVRQGFLVHRTQAAGAGDCRSGRRAGLTLSADKVELRVGRGRDGGQGIVIWR